MRPLTEDETRTLFEKLVKYIGKNVKLMIDQPAVLRIQRERVYLVPETLLPSAISVGREHLVSLGTCLGKFTKTKQFRLHITALPLLSQYARHKIWIKPNGEMSFLYGHHVLKAHLGRITDQTPKHAGVVFYSMSDVPLGFGITAYSTAECRKVESTAIVAFHQADVGEYLRIEDAGENASSLDDKPDDDKIEPGEPGYKP